MWPDMGARMPFSPANRKQNAPSYGLTTLTAKGSVEKLGIAFTTAQRAIERLERLGIVQQAGTAKRDRVYCAKALLDILEEPAHLVPSSN
jgi:hypothetical protein